MVRRGVVVLLAIAAWTAILACGRSPAAPSAPDPLDGFELTGNPESATGARWSFEARVAGVDYDLGGILLKPAGSGPFPAVIISHGNNSNAGRYSLDVATEMVSWGLVAIATSYTHAAGVPTGSPGSPSEAGASTANVQRARQLVEIVGGLGYVDMNRLALHGHSMGAFVTAATAGAYPTLFRAASHTAGGIAPNLDFLQGIVPTETQIDRIRMPYQMHHGDRDFVVPLLADELFAAALRDRGVRHELVIYRGATHDDLSRDPVMLERVRQWYVAAGIL
jgi:dienelactone hydrolase